MIHVKFNPVDTSPTWIDPLGYHGCHPGEEMSKRYGNILWDAYGDWTMPDISVNPFYISIETFLDYIDLAEIVPETVSFEDIAWKGKHLGKNKIGKQCICCNGKKYREADPYYPGILLDGAPNPYDLRYRMVDGKHRLERLLKKKDIEGQFYVLDYKRWLKYFKTYILN